MKTFYAMICFAMIAFGILAMIFKHVDYAIYANTFVVALKSIDIAQTLDFIEEREKR
ncbi:hypothetical protein D8827_07015 [Streptococcus intermedius]|uniref:Uncharacterized protein n=1 Tax=Streptococcus intermedius TaxID=1338 RepID=A0AAE8KBW2_STRIT|nr:hypothetical protein [Streptococcus intermedius]RSJ22638.1 hypothetical protein D8827_07015 [Streptococcus intermedius]